MSFTAPTGPIGATGPTGPTINMIRTFIPDRFKEDSWKPIFLWMPRKINGDWHWLGRAYRRRIWTYPRFVWEYGDAFDVLRDT